MSDIGAMRELPKYDSHKQVWALKIGKIIFHAAGEDEAKNGAATISPVDQGFAPFSVDRDWVDRNKPKDGSSMEGGYYVQYKDGYKSYSPAAAFEDGYVVAGEKVIVYKIQTPSEDPKQSVIEKSGDVYHFTLRDLEVNQQQLGKGKKEVEAKRLYESARMTNVAEHHPEIPKMDPEERFAAFMYCEAEAFVKACDKKLEEINAQLEADAAETAEILKQLPELSKEAPKVEATDQK